MSNSRRGKKNPPPIFEQIINVQMWFVMRYQFSHPDTFRGVKRRRRRKIPPYVTNSDNENGTKRNKMKRNETISTTASRILYRRQPCNDQGERTYILMYRYWCPAIDNSTRINHYFFFFFFREKKLEKQRFKYRKGGMNASCPFDV